MERLKDASETRVLRGRPYEIALQALRTDKEADELTAVLVAGVKTIKSRREK